MASTLIANIVDPEILTDQVNATFFDELAFATVMTRLENEVRTGGQFVDMPSWNIASSGAQEITEGGPLTTKAMNAKKERGVVVRRGDAWENYDTATLVSKANPTDALRGQIARLVAETIDDTTISVLTGGTNLEFDYSATGTIDATAVGNAKGKAGDQQGKFDAGIIVMHSKQFTDLVILGAITYKDNVGELGQTVRTGQVPFFMGMRVLTSDKLPTLTGPPVKYNAYLVVPGAIALMTQRDANVEFDRDILQKSDIVSYDVHFVSHIKGISWKTASPALPTEVQLQTAANWELKAEDAKLTGVVRLITQ